MNELHEAGRASGEPRRQRLRGSDRAAARHGSRGGRGWGAGRKRPNRGDPGGVWGRVLGRRDLSDVGAYALARALDKGHTDFAKRLPQAAETTPQNTAAAAPKPELIHPGVRKYLSEIGIKLS